MKKYLQKTLLLIYVLILIPVFAFSDVPLPGVEMPQKVKEALQLTAKTYQSGSLAKIFRERRENYGMLSHTTGAQSSLTVTVPLLLGTFSNSANLYSKKDFQEHIFDNNPTGSMVDYYREVSYGQLNLSGETFGWYSVAQPKNYYVNDGYYGILGGGARFVRDLVVIADASIDYSDYDYDDDGYVDLIMAVHTGPGAETQETERNNLWSHRGTLNAASVSYPGMMPDGEYVTNDPWPGHPGQYIKVNDYSLQPELKWGRDNSIAEIGVFCHEFGHVLGLPDLYDTDGSSAGIGNWGLMSHGMYGGDSNHYESPAHMCAWSKAFLGWIEPHIVLTSTHGKEIINSEQNPHSFYKIWKNGNPNREYFLIENRQSIGFDKYIYEPGLLVWHVDEDRIDVRLLSNKVNDNENYKGVDLEEADGRNDLDHFVNNGDDGDPFPGKSNNYRFDDYTNPNSIDYKGRESNIAINIVDTFDNIILADLLVNAQAEQSYFTVYNDGDSLLNVFNITSDKTWLHGHITSFSVQPSDSFNVTVIINWSALQNEATGNLTIHSNDPINPESYVKVHAVPKPDPPILSVTPDVQNVEASEGETLFNVANVGAGTMNWTAISNHSWITIVDGNSGIDNGTIRAHYAENTANVNREGSILVTAPGAKESPKLVKIYQLGAAGVNLTWEAAMIVNNSANETVTLYWGQGEDATEDIDTALEEAALPPAQTSNFDARWLLPVVPEVGSLKDYRNDTETAIEWHIYVQPGNAGYPISLTWDSSQIPEGNMVLSDNMTGTIINVNMKLQNSLAIASSVLQNLKITYIKEKKLTVDVVRGWNMISIPVKVDNMQKSSLFPDAQSEAFVFDNGYNQINTLQNGIGYWIKFAYPTSYEVEGSVISPQEISVKSGWNLIGPLDYQIRTVDIKSVPSGIISSKYFGFNKKYTMTDILKPGFGYWIKTSQSGKLVLTQRMIKQEDPNEQKNDWITLQIIDQDGNQSELYLADKININEYECPPTPPEGVYDIRFDSNSLLENLKENKHILFHSVNFPIKIRALNLQNKSIKLEDEFGGTFVSVQLEENKEIEINTTLQVIKLSLLNAPQDFRLLQNVPNPFNPTTTIRYSIPKESLVKIKIYNATGELIQELLNETKPAGNHEVIFDARSFASGLYFYRLECETFNETRKMIVLK